MITSHVPQSPSKPNLLSPRSTLGKPDDKITMRVVDNSKEVYQGDLPWSLHPTVADWDMSDKVNESEISRDQEPVEQNTFGQRDKHWLLSDSESEIGSDEDKFF